MRSTVSLFVKFSFLFVAVFGSPTVRNDGILKIPLTWGRRSDGLYGEVSLGTPPQKFNLTFQVNSHYTWVPSENCTQIFCEKKQFHGKESSTYTPSGLEIVNGDDVYGPIQGFIASEVLEFVSLKVPNQQFVEITKAGKSELGVRDWNGVLGLALESRTEEYKTFAQNLLSEKLLPKSVFSFYVNATNLPIKADFFLGGSPFEHYKDPMVHVPSTSRHQWEFHATQISLGELNLCTDGCKVVIDTYSDVLKVPQSKFVIFMARIGALPLPGSGIWFVPCPVRDSDPDLHVSLGKEKLVLPKEYFVSKMIDSQNQTSCIPLVDATEDTSETWTFGLPFFARFFTEFDFEQNRMGFAVAK